MLVLVLLLVTPAALVLVLRDDGGAVTDMRIARLPTDVAVLGDTVWVASGRDDRVVALEGGRSDRAEPHTTGPRRCGSPSAPARSGPRTRATAASRG